MAAPVPVSEGTEGKGSANVSFRKGAKDRLALPACGCSSSRMISDRKEVAGLRWGGVVGKRANAEGCCRLDIYAKNSGASGRAQRADPSPMTAKAPQKAG